MRPRPLAWCVATFLALVAAPAAMAGVSAETAALQIALRERGLYRGELDGRKGGGTLRALRRFQRSAGLPVTGALDRRTRRALGTLGRPRPGTRLLDVAMVGWDVSVLEFELARRGFDVGRIDGRFDGDTASAVRRFRRYAGLPNHCVVNAPTFAALERARRPTRVPVKLIWPARGRTVHRFGIDGIRLHAGVTIAAAFGAGVAAASDGRIAWAGWRPGGLGLVVRVVHESGVETVYGHLARVDVKVGERIVRGGWVGLVGKTGRARASQLHFEVRVRGAAVDPLKFLPRSG